jgi:arachidonate 15-lipoxygenase (second type)/8-lipoxygenase (S-type)
MIQLSENPYWISRVPKNAQLPFTVSNAKAITGQTLASLQEAGSLFLTEFLDQAQLWKNASRYGAAYQACFFIHPVSGDFLPLSIKPNIEDSDLVYTPQDLPNN